MKQNKLTVCLDNSVLNEQRKQGYTYLFYKFTKYPMECKVAVGNGGKYVHSSPCMPMLVRARGCREGLSRFQRRRLSCLTFSARF